tara:strand:- start:676 stop:1065 length:390 start_codon:yes stop_codon:yes gene_type:complete
MNKQQKTDKYAKIAMAIISGIIVFLFIIAISGCSNVYAQQNEPNIVEFKKFIKCWQDPGCPIDSAYLDSCFISPKEFSDIFNFYPNYDVDTCLVRNELKIISNNNPHNLVKTYGDRRIYECFITRISCH